MGICRLDIPVARRDFTATLAAPLPYYATLVVLFNTTVAAFLCSQETLLLEQLSPGIGFCLTRQPSASPIVRFIKQREVLAHTKSSIPILLLIFLLRGCT